MEGTEISRNWVEAKEPERKKERVQGGEAKQMVRTCIEKDSGKCSNENMEDS